MNSAGLLKINLPDGLLHTEYYYNRKIKEANVVISISCLKTHWSAGITGSCKNIGIGAPPANIYGASENNPYRGNMVTHDNSSGDLHKWIRDYYKCRPADYTIIDGLQGLQNGPISSSSSDKMNMRLILAGKDAVAVDTICGLVMNWDPESIGYLKYLNADSIGNLDTACINVLGKKVDEVRKDFAGRTPVGGGSKVTDKTPPTLSINSSSLQGNTINLNLSAGSDTTKAEVYIDGVLQQPAILSNFTNISLNTSGISTGNHTISVNVYDRYLNRTEKTVSVNGGTTTVTAPITTATSSPNLPNTTSDYNAPIASQAPTIDGSGNESCWSSAQWRTINNVWLGNTPTTADFSGRYKIVWTADRLYYLVEITDDVFSAPYSDPLKNYYNNDCVDLFIDENHSGGEHTNNYNAFAYHIQKNGDVTDNATNGSQKTFNDHVQVKVTNSGNVYTWEIAMKVFPDTYNENSTTNQPVTLQQNKILGYGVSYNDNDGGTTRDNFIGSMYIEGTDKNVAYKNASVFDALQLVSQNASTVSPNTSSQAPVSTPPRTTVNTTTPNTTTSNTSTNNACVVVYGLNDWEVVQQ